MTDQLIIMFLVGFGLVAGYFVSKTAEKRDPVHSKGVARMFHFLASATLISVGPTVLASIFFLHLPPLRLLLVLVGIFVSTFILLVPFALLEKPLLQQAGPQVDTGWTKEDAEQSGL